MSHISKIKLTIKSLAALKKAAEVLELEFVEASTYRWWGRWMRDSPLPAGVKESDLGKCNYKLRIPGNVKAYEVGVIKQPDGTFALHYDFWSGGYGLEAKIGQGAKKLIQEYSTQVAMRQLMLSGMQVKRTLNTKGQVVLVAQ